MFQLLQFIFRCSNIILYLCNYQLLVLGTMCSSLSFLGILCLYLWWCLFLVLFSWRYLFLVSGFVFDVEFPFKLSCSCVVLMLQCCTLTGCLLHGYQLLLWDEYVRKGVQVMMWLWCCFLRLYAWNFSMAFMFTFVCYM